MVRKADKRGYLIPDQIDDHPLLCVQLAIPNVREYRAAFVGQLVELMYHWKWGDRSTDAGEAEAQAVAEYWRGLLLPVTDKLITTEGECANAMDVRQNPTQPCKLEKRTNNEDDPWVQWADLRKCKPVVRTMPDGSVQIQDPDTGEWQDTQQYDPREDPEALPPDPTPVSGQNPKCMAAERIMQYFKSQSNALVAEMNLGFDAATAGATVFGAAALVMGLPVAAVAAMQVGIAGLVGVTSSIINIEIATFDWKKFKCQLFNLMPNDGLMTQAVYNSIGVLLDGYGPLFMFIMNLWWDELGEYGARQILAKSTITESGDCCGWHFLLGEVQTVSKYPNPADWWSYYSHTHIAQGLCVGYYFRLIECSTGYPPGIIGLDQGQLPDPPPSIAAWTGEIDKGKRVFTVCNGWFAVHNPQVSGTEIRQKFKEMDITIQDPECYIQTGTFSPEGMKAVSDVGETLDLRFRFMRGISYLKYEWAPIYVVE